MKIDDLLKDPVFQLNLLIWMTKDQPASGYRVRPFFASMQFKIQFIEQPFRFPEQLAQIIRQSQLEISVAPEPELTLGRESDQKALYFESKADSFGTQSSNCKQARGHLLASGPAFAEVYSPLKECVLCYLLPSAASGPMTATLRALDSELRAVPFQTGVFSCHGLAARDRQVVYVWDAQLSGYLDLSGSEVGVLDDVHEDTDPSPLVLVFSDEDCANDSVRDFYRRVVLEQIRASLLTELHAMSSASQFQTTTEALLLKTSDGVFQYLGRERQKNLMRLVRQNIFRKIAVHWKDKTTDILVNVHSLTVSSNGSISALRDWLEDYKTIFDTARPADDAPDLFTDSDEKTE